MKTALARLSGVILALLCLPAAASGQFLPLSEHRLSGGGTTDATSSRLWVVNLWSPSRQPATRAQLLSVQPGHVAVVAQDRGVSYGAIAPAPDGSRVAFINRSALWVVRQDGTGRHRVVGPPRSPCQNPISIDYMAWAPGGQRLAYTAAL